MSLLVLFELYRAALRALAVLMGAHFLTSTVAYLRRGRPQPLPLPPAEWPKVTVHLPIRDEYYAALRVINAVADLDYPRECLQVEVLDDSTDATSALIADRVAELKNLGVDIAHRRRLAPIGYKAGALRDGLVSSSGELIAIFDADFIPPRDFLRRTVPHFSDPNVGMVQGRWDHRNRRESWFTRLQAQILDGLMIVEQTAKSRAGLPLQFNGTAGVWRRTAIDSAGGWTFDSLTEDLDLSIRAYFRGWRLVHLPDLPVPGELPPSLGLFRVQQRRWALGTAQLLRKRIWEVLRAPIPIAARVSLVFQLARHFGHPLLLVMVATVPLTTFGVIETWVDYGWTNALVLAVPTAGVCAQHYVAARATGRSVIAALLLAPFVIPLAIGLAPTYTVALWYGLRDRAGAFHRTPKVTRAPKLGEPVYRARRSILVIAEALTGFVYAALTLLALERQLWLDAAFMALIAFSFIWMGLGSLRVDATSVALHHETAPEPPRPKALTKPESVQDAARGGG